MRRAVLVLAGLGAFATTDANACPGWHDGFHQRTPVLWEGEGCDAPLAVQCGTVVDRSRATSLHLEYGVPFDDVCLEPEELPGTHRHQFFALCRDSPPFEPLPSWITDADVALAVDAGIIEPGYVTPQDVLEHAEPWSDCWARITADDPRVPITCEAAAQGVDWDVTAVAAGVYRIAGYVWEPWINQWFPRPGFVIVHDGDRDAVGPAIAATLEREAIYRDELATIVGCVDALPGSRIRASWIIEEPAGESWTPFATELDVDGPTFALELDVPPEGWGEALWLRIDVVDPQGRTDSSFPRDALAIIDADAPVDGSSDGGTTSVPPPAETSSTSDASTSSAAPPELDAPAVDRGCACDGANAPAPRVALALIVVFSVPRRRAGGAVVLAQRGSARAPAAVASA